MIRDNPTSTLVSHRAAGAVAPGESVISDRRALTFVAVAAGLAAAVYSYLTLTLDVPWIMPDELIYSELAKSLADGSVPSIRGEATLGYGLVYPAIIAPAWAIFEDPSRAYAAAKIIDAVVMALAAFPAYFLARRFVLPSSAVVVATFSVLVPSMLHSGALLIEPVLFPIFLLALLAVVAAIQQPSRRNQLLAVSAIGLACLTKPLSVVLVPVYVLVVVHLGLLDRRECGVRRRLRAHSTAVGVIAALTVLAVAGPALRGDPDAALGVYGVVLGNIDVPGTVVWFVRHLAGLDLYVAVIPFAATATLIAWSGRRDADDRVREFGVVAFWTIVATVGAVAAYASKPLAGASGYLPSEARLHERNIFALVPLLLVGLALLIETRQRVPRRLFAVVAVVSAFLPAILPLERLRVNANFQALFLLPWTAGGIERFWPLTYIPLALTALAMVLISRQQFARGSWTLVACLFVVTLVAAHASMTHETARATGVGTVKRWIDDSVPRGASVLALWIPATLWRGRRGQRLDLDERVPEPKGREGRRGRHSDAL